MIKGFLLKRPDKSRRTFQIVPYLRADGKRVYYKPIENQALASLNQSLLAGALTAAEAETEIKARILPELKRQAGTRTRAQIEAVISDSNLKAYKAFWSREYRRKPLERAKTAQDEFMTALRILEPLSLHTCDVDDLQDHWDSKENGTRHKRYGNRVNQLLDFLNRGFRIRTKRAVKPPLKYVTWAELEKINQEVSDPVLRDLYRALYGTGARLGELFLLQPDEVRDNGTLYIHQQVTPSREAKPYTKNKVAHDTIILPEALDAVKRWAAAGDKIAYRKRCQNPLIYASRKVFPTQPMKHIGPHKLRHSYVKQMMTLGVPIDRIAQFLGDKVSTIEAVYRQWTVNDAEIDHVRAIMKSGYRRLRGR